MDKTPKDRPVYAVASVDHALLLATVLQLEGRLTVAEAAARLGVARSTAHRLLQMLVYRDFAAQAADKSYRAGPVLELAAHSRSDTARLRAAALPALERLAEVVQESANVAIRVGATARFIASVESPQSLRVGTREGMVFPAHRTTAGLLLLSELDAGELAAVIETAGTGQSDVPDLPRLVRELELIRRQGFAVNREESERGVTAIGVPVRNADRRTVAGISLSMPSVRYDPQQLLRLVDVLQRAGRSIEADLRQAVP
ncbi:IclR family transcriptional regulator [Nocardioides sp. LHD-245]|uniref:IclR family transcriptional regulator n=1 Tax=Nocardioides sp. LHD-245 TaxID=3051387 RepID=UPI0027E12133|nr:IclR family transcriptional regulator [Nocardioides sp. LHD-245]